MESRNGLEGSFVVCSLVTDLIHSTHMHEKAADIIFLREILAGLILLTLTSGSIVLALI